MGITRKTDFELLLFERHHVKCLKKIIEVKNKQINILSSELKLVVDNEFVDTVIVVEAKDSRRVHRIKELENRLIYFKNRYNRLLKSLTH